MHESIVFYGQRDQASTDFRSKLNVIRAHARVVSARAVCPDAKARCSTVTTGKRHDCEAYRRYLDLTCRIIVIQDTTSHL